MRRRRRQPTKRKCAPIASQPISLFPR